MKLSTIKRKYVRLGVVTLGAFGLAAGATQAHHWPQGGAGPARPGYQVTDPAQLPFTFRYQAATGSPAGAGAVISGGATLADQRVVTGIVTVNGILGGVEDNARINVRDFATGALVSTASSVDIDDEEPLEPPRTGNNDGDWWGPTRLNHPIIASDHGSAGQIYAVYNDDNQPNESESAAGENDIALAQVDAATGVLQGDHGIGSIFPENLDGGTDGFTIDSAPVMSPDLGSGTRKIAFTMRYTGATETVGASHVVQLTVPAAATTGDHAYDGAASFDPGPVIPDVNTNIPPSYVYMRDPDSGSRVLMVAVATKDGIKTFRSSNLADPGPSISGIGPATMIASPVRTDGNPATHVECPPRPDCSVPLYVATTVGESTVVRKLIQDEGNLRDPARLATLIPADGVSTSPELPGIPARGIALEQAIPTTGVNQGVPQPGRVVVGTSKNAYVLDADNLAAAPTKVFGIDRLDGSGFESTIPAVSGGLGFLVDKKGQQFVFYTDPEMLNEDNDLLVLPDESGFQPNEQALNSTSSIGQPAISRGRVVFPANNGIFLYGPTVAITRPAANQSVFGNTVALEAYVQDPALTTVNFFVDGELVGTDVVNDNRLFSIDWDATQVADGPHTVRAEATDGVATEVSPSRTFVVNNFRDPTALLTLTPTRANPGQPVTLDASASKPTLHEDETIVEWAFDIDGDDDFNDIVERADQGGDGKVARAFPAGTHQIWVRVTDSNGDAAQALANLRVNTAPAANLAVGPNPAAEGQEVTLDAGASTDVDGSIAKYEFDLDGNGTFELDNGANPKVQRVFAPGTTKLAARVTDNEGAASTVEATLTVNATPANQAPTATFRVTPNPVNRDQRVLFDATGAVDPDGRIVKYEWDLDGNGTFETNSQNNPRVQRSYATAKVYTVKLRVTDNVGAVSTEFSGTLTVRGAVARKSPRRITAKVTPMRDAALPFDFRTTGRLTRPSGVSKKAGCTGRVTVTVKAGRKTISRRTTKLRSNCTYRTSVRFRDRSRMGNSTALRFTARFQGNKALRARQATTVRVRVAR